MLRATKPIVTIMALMFCVHMAFNSVPIGEEIKIFGSASAMDADDQAALEENITDTMIGWIPFVVAMSFVGLALGYLGIRMKQQ